MNTVEVDWLYDIWSNDGHFLLSERLIALGWTGDEEIPKQEELELYDHLEYGLR